MSKRRPNWFGQLPLTRRILAVNLLTIVLLAFGVLYLDAFRNQLSEERLTLIHREAEMTASVLAMTPAPARDSVLLSLAKSTGSRIRLYGSDGSLRSDSWKATGPTYTLRDPTTQKWNKDAARALDRGFNALVGAKPLDDFIEPAEDKLQSWSEGTYARQTGQAVTKVRNAPDLTPVFSAAAPVGEETVLLTTNDREFTRTIRSQRTSLAIAMAIAVVLSVLLSLFLARTIVRPLRRIALAAHRVRLGRAREVKVPRLPSRTDEIGQLARSVSDMSQSLRQRMDNIEHFAADVTHELKNPLASLRSALDGLDRVEDPKLKLQLLAVAKDDVVRLDRLIGDISEAARTDAELARAKFEPVDLGPVIEQLVSSWEHRREKGDAHLAFARPRRATAVVLGDANRLVRAIDNIIDNAISFSPPGGLVEIAAARVGDEVRIRIDDEGPGVPEEAREAIFNRFHSIRPEEEHFGRHSGLGLAIARAIVEGHDGEIDVQDRDDAPSGARFTITLPATEAA
ncbi:sensor N-terminal transmembrane domain-containing protein [Sphingomonas sediminicola]|uniref:histidine kinase n=1 Tax=Sphingomonas sediminicola TaxID=386874 RepID=A0ABX6T9N9_9SPHN|nr:ATP-binding protein [Sphingomonas sediminicola]QNP46579.1 sensor N-terminal transmembrane domain-containing protein [Sphingomonas sediminicola]